MVFKKEIKKIKRIAKTLKSKYVLTMTNLNR